MPDTPEGLLRACEAAQKDGMDFPSLWRTIITRHALVVGLPAHRVANGEAQIVVTLLTGQKLISSARGFSLD
jgi:hypothetical protein